MERIVVFSGDLDLGSVGAGDWIFVKRADFGRVSAVSCGGIFVFDDDGAIELLEDLCGRLFGGVVGEFSVDVVPEEDEFVSVFGSSSDGGIHGIRRFADNRDLKIFSDMLFIFENFGVVEADDSMAEILHGENGITEKGECEPNVMFGIMTDGGEKRTQWVFGVK